MDTMVLENDEARKAKAFSRLTRRSRVPSPAEERGRYMVEAVFGGGSKRSNQGEMVEKMLVDIIDKIRHE